MSIVTKSKFIDKYSNFNVMIGGSRSVGFHICTAWLYTCNDFKVIVIPETAIGIFNALAGGLTTNSAPNISSILPRIPRVLFWNWFNLLVFNVANQRLANSILEDAVNKPWRPSPSNRISPDGARRLLLALIPCGVLISCFIGGLQETVAMLILTWMYNDLGGADENYLLRNLINAVAFMCHGSGATIIAAGFCDYELTTKAYTWLAIIGAVIFTTLQVQDIPDMKGDAARGRRTLPLVHGDWIGRCSVALPVLAWSFACPTFWQLDYDGFILPASVGALVVFRTLTMKSIAADQTTYKIWCLWLTTLYLLPLYKNHSVFSSINGSPTLLLKDGYSIIQICLSVPIITRLLVLVAALVPVVSCS